MENKHITECYYSDCPYHHKIEPLGSCYIEDSQFSELCRKYRLLYDEKEEKSISGYTTITLNLDLNLIHQLYGLAIAWNTTIDEVVNEILKKYFEKYEEEIYKEVEKNR